MRVQFFPSSSRTNEERRRICLDESIQTSFSNSYHKFGYDYFDNPDLGIGYGGFSYDGRYADAASRICQFYGLKPGDRVLEIGCAKGFLLVEFLSLGMKVAGLDLSEYAIRSSHPTVKGRIQLGDSIHLPFRDSSFDLVVAKEVLPHIPADGLNVAINECMRVAKGPIFFEIQCGETPVEIDYMLRWDPTHQTARSSKWWDALFANLGYEGDVNYKVLITEEN